MASSNDLTQNLNNLMKEAQKMQQKMQSAQQELSELTVTGKAGGEMVTIEMNGLHNVKKVTISPRALSDADPEDLVMLGDLLCAGFNDAANQVEKVSKTKITELTAGMQIPKDLIEKEEE